MIASYVHLVTRLLFYRRKILEKFRNKTRLKRLSVLDRDIRYILGVFKTFKTLGTF